MKQQTSGKKVVYYLILAAVIIGIRYYFQEDKPKNIPVPVENIQPSQNQNNSTEKEATDKEKIIVGIDELTDEKVVIAYLKKNKALPDYYITKNKARDKGWNPAQGNLCEILPGKAIGGDHFGNREGLLPAKKGRKYYEADLNYNCGRRNADRVVFSNDGLVFITKDHYQSFQEQ